MKLIVLLLSIIAIPYSATYGQYTEKHSFTLEWSEVDPTVSGQYSETFVGSTNIPGQKPSYGYRVNIPVRGAVTATLEPTETKTARPAPHITNSSYEVDAYTSTQGSSHFVNISITPLRQTSDGYEKIISAELVITIVPDLTSTSRDPIFASESVLKSGTFFKMAISATGAYSITGEALASELGLSLTDLRKDQLQMYAGHPGRLPEKVDAERVDDLMEVPIQITGSGSTMAATDELRFFAHGPDQWHYNTDTEEYTYDRNPYASVSYVYLRTDGQGGIRINDAQATASPTYTSSTYDYLQRYEFDNVNLLGSNAQTEGSGQDWYGDYFGSQTEQDLTSRFDFEGVLKDVPAKVEYRMAARAASNTSSTMRIGNAEIENNYQSVQLDNPEGSVARARVGNNNSVLLGDSPSVTVRFENNSINDQAWLDYIQLETERTVDLYGSQTIIRDRESIQHATARFTAADAASTVWQITDQAQVANVSVTNGGWTYSTNGTLQQFLIIGEYLTPEVVGPVANQNLHAIDQADMVIVHPDFLTDQAARLAEHRSDFDGLTVETVVVSDIYNEFSGGKLDPTAIRDFAKMLHDKTDNFRYLLLLGDASYDYRNLVQGVPDHNFVPCYQTQESLHPIYAFPSDDYFGLLSNDEGGTELLIGDLDIQVGRLPASEEEHAADMIDKIIAYDTNDNRYGDWRLNIGFAADDQDSNTHIDDSDELAISVRESDPVFNQQKVYFDAFEQISTPGGDRYYDASTAINTSIQNGQLVLNYLGHGGPSGWAQERVLKNTDIDTWNNGEQLPILLTATCTFTGYDDPSVVSSGEYAIRKKDGGCVALLTTVRAVFAFQNAALANSILSNIFKLDDSGKARTLGEIMTEGKNNLNSDSRNLRKFALIGDPAMRIAVPTQKVVATHINGESVNGGNLDTLRALEEVTLDGMVTSQDGQKLSDFNGTVSLTVFDKESTLETRANDPDSRKKSFQVFRNILFKGKATVTNGEFSISFVLPKDINYRFGTGRISMYADNGSNLDAAGYFEDVVIGGSSDQIVTDDLGPEIQLYMNDTSFKDGGITNKDATLLVHLSDDLGINTSGNSIGHDLTATIDGDQVYVLNNFYEASIDDARRGIAAFPLNDLEVGLHTATVKAWDLANNSAIATITFEVVDGTDGKVRNILIYPNPMTSFDQGVLVFEHDLLGEDLELGLSLYNTAGQHVAQCNENIMPTGNRVELPIYSLGCSKLDDLPVGMYFYKINLQGSQLSTFRESDFGKLVKAR